jgi:sigma-B regulation protein RsbU (phosphoserine phosphatase)
MSGVDVCRRVRERQTDQPPYLIMLTSKGDKQDIVTGLESGADDYLSKPFVLEELRARVDVGRRMLDLQAAMTNKVQELTRWQNQMVRELKVAALLQTKLLATTPLLTTRHDVRMLYHPCLHVGGDFFDALDLPDGRLCVYVGDVAGHGVGPALIAALMKAVISDVVRVMADCGPAHLCREINSRFRDQVPDIDVYVTLFLLVHDPVTNQWRGMNCGHPPPLLLNQAGEDLSSSLACKGSLPLGIVTNLNTEILYDASEEVSAPANPGDLLFLFTDGLLEARHKVSGTPCGVDTLRNALSHVARDPLAFDYPTRVWEQITDNGYELSHDDCCALSVHLTLPHELALDLLVDPDGNAQATASTAVELTLKTAGWPEPSSARVVLLAQAYVASVLEHDRVPAGTQIRLQVRLTRESCRLLFSSEGRERDQAARLADLQARLYAPENKHTQDRLAQIIPQGDLYRRGSQNVAFFVFDKTDGEATTETVTRPHPSFPVPEIETISRSTL